MDYRIQGDTLTALADAVRGKAGSTDVMTPADMVTAIGKIEAGNGAIQYIIGEPTAFTLAASDWDGTTYTLSVSGYTVGSGGLQLGLMPGSSVVNTQAAVEAALTLPSYAESSSEDEETGETTYTVKIYISAVTAPTQDVVVAIYGLEAV